MHGKAAAVPSILGSAWDRANLTTLSGGLCAIAAIYCVYREQFAVSLVLALWAHFFDSLDGWVARHDAQRNPEKAKIGKQLDSFVDLLAAGAYPLIFLVTIGAGNVLSIVGGALLAIAGLLRLSYFNVHGCHDGYFTGLPLPHNILLLSSVYFIIDLMEADLQTSFLGVAAIFMSALHVSNFRFPKTPENLVFAEFLFVALCSATVIHGP